MYISERELEIEQSNLISEVYQCFEDKEVRDNFIKIIDLIELFKHGYDENLIYKVVKKLHDIKYFPNYCVHDVCILFFLLFDYEFEPVLNLAEKLNIESKHMYAFNNKMSELMIEMCKYSDDRRYYED
jgi:hypothetical protein